MIKFTDIAPQNNVTSEIIKAIFSKITLDFQEKEVNELYYSCNFIQQLMLQQHPRNLFLLQYKKLKFNINKYCWFQIIQVINHEFDKIDVRVEKKVLDAPTVSEYFNFLWV